MTNEVIWTKLVLERFIQLANLTEEEEIVIRGGEPVTESGLCNAMNFNGLENSVGRLNDSLQAAMCGVVRYPNATTYCSGSNPFGGCGCGAAI